jgi:cupin superfamily acireductone dioxygenase involved in methionine salvage
MVRQLNESEITFEQFKHVTFGAQDYAGDDHFALYTPTTLERLLRAAGFESVDTLVTDRQNGLSPEMELIARPGTVRR